MSAPGRILVVDDEPEIRQAIQEYLEMRGYRVTPAEDGQAMRRIVAREPVDLVLLDTAMPGEDSLPLARF